MKKVLEYLSPVSITVVLFLIVYIILGITPFGENTLFHYDMGLQYYPALTLMHDVLHGERGVFYNFNIGGGESAYATLISNGFYSPVNWLVALGERESIPTTTSWVLMIKFCLISLSTYYVLKKFFPNLNEKWILLGALLNTFSSYSLLYYVNFQWIESWALFPIIMLGLKNILDGKSGVIFTISLTACLLISFYMSWLILLIIIFGGILGLIFYTAKENRIKAACKIFFNTLFSLLISFISFYPAFTTSMNSYRMENTNEFLKDINPILFKSIHILTSPILLFYTFKMITNYKNDKRNVKFLGGLLLLTTIPLFVESINKMWHTGSYSGLPFRFGFINIFIMICSMLHYIDVRKKFEVKEIEKTKNKIGKIIISVIILVYVLFCIYSIKVLGDYQYIIGEILVKDTQNYINMYISVIIGITILGCVTEFRNEKLEFDAVKIVFVISSLFLMLSYIKTLDEFSLENKLENESIFIAEDFYQDFYDGDEIYKVKDNTQKLLYNYPYILKMNSIENWFHIIPERQVNSLEKLGYSYYKVVQEDNGGTLISDLILGVNKIFSSDDKNEKIYKLLENKNSINLYAYNFKELPFSKIYEDSKNIENFLDKNFKIENIFKVQNDLYKTFFGENDDIIEIIQNDVGLFESKEGKYTVNDKLNITYDMNLNSLSNIYFYMYNPENCAVTINIYDSNKNLIYKSEEEYPTGGNNGILDIGVLEKGSYTVNINFIVENEELEANFSNIELGILNLDKLLNSVNEMYEYEEKFELGKNEFKISLQVDEKNQKLFIPINYSEGWSAKVNGKYVDIVPVLGTYMGITLEKGINEIEFSYFPENLKLSIYVTIIFILIYFILVLICKITKIEESKLAKIIYFIGVILFVLIFVIFAFVIYIKPIV